MLQSLLVGWTGCSAYDYICCLADTQPFLHANSFFVLLSQPGSETGSSGTIDLSDYPIPHTSQNPCRQGGTASIHKSNACALHGSARRACWPGSPQKVSCTDRVCPIHKGYRLCIYLLASSLLQKDNIRSRTTRSPGSTLHSLLPCFNLTHVRTDLQ